MRKRILIGIIIFLGIIAIYTVKSEATFKINDFNINCELYENGDMFVEENITYAYDENQKKNGLIRTINIKNNMNLKNSADKFSLEEVLVDGDVYNRVSSANIGDSGVYTRKNTGNEYEIKVFSPFEQYTKTVTYKYKLSNVAVKYNDISELYWNFIGDEWDCKIDNVKIGIKLPEQSRNETIYVYGHGSDNGTFAKTGNYITLMASNINAYQTIDARILFSTNAIPYSTKEVNKNVLNQYIEQEEGMTAERGEIKILFGLSVKEIALTLSGIILIVGIIIYIKYDKEYKVEKYKYYREIPYDLDPEILQKIYYGKKVKDSFFITFLNLVKMGVFRIEKTTNKVGKETEKIIFNKDVDNLKEYQNIVKDTIKGVMKNGEIDLLKLQAKMKTSTSNKSIKFYKELNSETEGLFGKTKKAPKKIISVLSIAMIILIILITFMAFKNNMESESFIDIPIFLGFTTLIYSIFFAAMGNYWPSLIFLLVHCSAFQAANISMLISCGVGMMYIPYVLLFILIQYVTRVKKKSKEERRVLEQLKGLRRYIRDYSMLSEKEEITQVTLWEDYFILAIALGLNNKVVKDLYEYGQVFTESNLETSLYNIGGYMYIKTTMRPAFHLFVGSSITGSSSGRSSSYSGSSGGFSGGSSSGGGGRRRWRRKLLLI